MFQWGHRGDLEFVGVQRVLSGLHEWWVKSGQFFPQPPLSVPHVLDEISSFLLKWNWTWLRWGVWIHPSRGLLNVRDPPDAFQASLHELRESWRCNLFNSWLHSKRRDSAVARNVGLRYDEVKILHLRRLMPTLTGDEAAVAVGGMSTPATCAVSLCAPCFVGLPGLSVSS